MRFDRHTLPSTILVDLHLRKCNRPALCEQPIDVMEVDNGLATL